jgi:peroxiredoxin
MKANERRLPWIVAACCLLPLVFFAVASLVTTSRDRGAERPKGPVVGLDVGDIAPSFEIVSIDGRTIRSEGLRGKVVVLTSQAAWCQTCAAEAAQLSAVYEQYKDKPVVFLTIDIDPRDTPEAIGESRKDFGTPWDYAAAPQAAQLIHNYRLNRFELTYLIDKEGVIRYRDAVITDAQALEGILLKWL